MRRFLLLVGILVAVGCVGGPDTVPARPDQEFRDHLSDDRSWEQQQELINDTRQSLQNLKFQPPIKFE